MEGRRTMEAFRVAILRDGRGRRSDDGKFRRDVGSALSFPQISLTICCQKKYRCPPWLTDKPGQDTAGNEPGTQCERGHLRSSSRCLRFSCRLRYRIRALSVRSTPLSSQAWRGEKPPATFHAPRLRCILFAVA